MLADCFSGLSRHRPNTIIILIDRLVEELYRGLENPLKRDAQRLISTVKLLGELYNYSVLSSQVVFDVLYFIINFGHDFQPNENSPPITEKYHPKFMTELDVPGDCFRAQVSFIYLKFVHMISY